MFQVKHNNSEIKFVSLTSVLIQMSLRQATTNNMQILSVFEPSNRQNTSEG